MRRFQQMLPAFGLIILAACASPSEPTPEPAANTAAAPVPIDEAFNLGALPAQSLEPGQCGLFLFAPRPTPRFVFFSNASTGYAKMMLDGEVITLSRSFAAGEVFDQSFATTHFIAPAHELTVEVNVRAGNPTDGGTEISSGSLNLQKTDSWSMIVPIAGASTCQPN